MSLPILICDDSALARKQVNKSLPEGWDVEVTFAKHGLEAVEHLRQHHVALLFLDLTMPELDGIGVLETIKKEKLEVFVIVISADIQPEMKKRVMDLGALDFIHKPVNRVKLTEILNKFGLL
ncbi:MULTISPECIES: response regulator [Corallincola]|uniref:Response regulator n=3 Tax=Corallincola TaxID=1775176 RepID=A0A368N793_9GAMM|nr:MULTISPECIES: response regulator [Corallincola]RCU45395.1 response regulator [Corallincola holothuriorum]TAA41096.1 response regulator [Corallincola spongiicola]TCI02747.1 response regulator [Corallincola luteus]